MRVISRRQPRGAKPAPKKKGKPVELPQLVGQDSELFLQGEPYAHDETYICRPTYITSAWLGVVSAYRSQLFYDHIPLSSVRKVRGTIYYTRRLNSDPYSNVDFDNPEKVIDLINEEVIVSLQGNHQLPDSEFRTRLLYVKKNWVGVASVFSNRLLPDHFPLTAIRKITKVVLIGRHANR
jgi:hypothetical protein